MLHDLGKTKYLRFNKKTKQPERKRGKNGRDHGLKSVEMIEESGFELNEMEADHIIPWHSGGATIASNCQMLCKDCNRRKSGK